MAYAEFDLCRPSSGMGNSPVSYTLNKSTTYWTQYFFRYEPYRESSVMMPQMAHVSFLFPKPWWLKRKKMA
jgi:hypothetical protein